jgi:hypothetical protein
MAKHVFLALTNPVEGKENEFNEWYDKHHVPDVVNVPGFISGQRFKLADAQFGNAEATKAYKYLAVYEIETDDIAATIKELIARGGTADITPSDAIDRKALTYMFTPIRDKVMAKDVKRPRRAA